MSHLFQPILANGAVILQMVFYAWMATMILSGVLGVIALLLAIFRQPVLTVRVLAVIAGVIDLVPIAIVLWVVFGPAFFGPGARPPLSLYQFTVLFLTLIPGLVASAALLLSFRPHPHPAPKSASSSA